MGNILFIKRTPLPIFYKRRASRIFPAFLIFVIAIYSFGFIYEFDFTAKEVVSTLTFMRTYLPAGIGIWEASLPIGHLWSLNVEEHGYLIMSLLTIPLIFRTKAWIPLGFIALGTIAIHLAYIYKLFPSQSNYGLRTECALTHLMLSASYCQVAHKIRKKRLFVVSSGFQKMLYGRGQQVDDADERVIVAVSPGPAFGGLEDAVECLDACVAVA